VEVQGVGRDNHDLRLAPLARDGKGPLSVLPRPSEIAGEGERRRTLRQGAETQRERLS
jgi:hypothetical protein